MYKRGVLTLVAIPLCLSLGCKPKKDTASPEDYFPLAIAGLEIGKTAAYIARNDFIEKKNFAGCVTSEVLAAAFDAGEQVLDKKMIDKIVIPALDVDVSECMPFNPHEPKSHEDIAQIFEAVTGAGVSVAMIYAKKLEITDCKKGKAVLGVLDWINKIIDPIAQEISKPDGVFSTPAVTLDLNCG